MSTGSLSSSDGQHSPPPALPPPARIPKSSSQNSLNYSRRPSTTKSIDILPEDVSGIDFAPALPEPKLRKPLPLPRTKAPPPIPVDFPPSHAPRSEPERSEFFFWIANLRRVIVSQRNVIDWLIDLTDWLINWIEAPRFLFFSVRMICRRSPMSPATRLWSPISINHRKKSTAILCLMLLWRNADPSAKVIHPLVRSSGWSAVPLRV